MVESLKKILRFVVNDKKKQIFWGMKFFQGILCQTVMKEIFRSKGAVMNFS